MVSKEHTQYPLRFHVCLRERKSHTHSLVLGPPAPRVSCHLFTVSYLAKPDVGSDNKCFSLRWKCRVYMYTKRVDGLELIPKLGRLWTGVEGARRGGGGGGRVNHGLKGEAIF